jgi:hypothetical protein
MRSIALALLLVAGFLEAPNAPPQAEQDRMVAAMRDYAADYTAKLPNFTCEEVTSQFEGGRKANRWRQGDTLRARLIYNNGREERKLLAVNDTAVAAYHRGWQKPLTVEGEFGELMIGILAPETAAKFSWGGWEDRESRRLARFDYAIDQQHSILSLSLSDLSQARVATHGSLWADPQTGALWRISVEADDIPKAVRTRSSITTIEYGEVQIGGKAYLLPVRAEAMVSYEGKTARNEIRFEGYRKFETESTITFGDPPQSPK